MYFPYLRGRQNELIAIRELITKSLLSEKVIPIIEPVKASPTLISTLNKFSLEDRELIFIHNPKVGSIVSDLRKKEDSKVNDLKEAIYKKNIIPAIIVDENKEILLKNLTDKGIDSASVVAICTKRDYVQNCENIFKSAFKYNIVPYGPAFRRIRGDRILLGDRFVKQERNTDYAFEDDEFFSDDHLYCYEEGFKGFSDFSIVGEEYKESGFAPYAVAIHIVYFSDDRSLRIKHFVSDSNDDISDPANKFYEAVSKLVAWNKSMKLNTFGIRTFEEMYENGSYPGLGIVKKLSIMHHIELMGKYLDGDSV